MDVRTKAAHLIAAVVASAVVVAVIVVLLGASSGHGDTDRKAGATTQKTAQGTGVARQPYGQAMPANAPGQTLYFQKVTIGPHARLAEHFHQGTQLARVVSGTLTYNIVSGTVSVTRANGKTDDVAGPNTVLLHAGDALIETASLVHYGANDTAKPVVIELTALLENGAPLATTVGTGAAGTPLHLTTALASQMRTLLTAGSITYGWNRLIGTASLDGKPVLVDMLGNVNYATGNGPFFGFITFTFDDKSTLAVSMQGQAVQSPNGASTVAATLGLLGGTGRYDKATGTGTFVGARPAAVGATVDSTFDLKVSGGP